MARHLRKCVAVLTVLFTLTNARLGDSGGKQHGNGNSEAHSSVVAIRGYKVSLPCDLSSPIPDDPVQLILWYREDTGAPIYTFDVRGRDYYSAKTWRDDESWGERASLDPTRRRPLMLRSVKAEDEGVYRCRVDFKMSPTRNSLVNLTVIVPPEVPKIYEKSGREMGSVIGPYLEGDNLTLICRGVHGRPAPKLIWFHEQALLDSTYTVYENGTVENVLEVSRLKRNDLNTTFSCQASNNNVTDAVSNPVRLSMNFRPYEVKILGSRNAALSADQSYPIACHAIGSWPPAVITWWKNGIRLNGTEELTTDGGNVSRSTVMYTPRVDDVGKFLVCRAENPEIPGSAIEDRWSPEIYYVPIPKLVLGKNLNKDNIREGIDVYFDCEIKSNPKFFKVSWKHNGLPLHHYNKSSGIILSDRHLAIQKVSRHQAGNYSCLAVNTEGVGESMRVELSVKYAPVCSKRQKKVYGVARREKVLVKCEIEAEPGAESFRWRFNNSDENYDIPQMSFTTSPEGSVLTYTPMTEKDYGTLTCWGTNEVGQQQEPCVFQVVPAGEPDPPHNCSISNQTSTFLEIDCEQGFDGGLAQFFVMEVYDASSQLLKYNVSSEVPHFVVDGLVPGSSLIISMYAANGKGKSSNLVFQASTLRLPERITDANTVKPTLEAFRITPVLGILIGVVAALVMAALIIVVVMKFRDSAMRSKNSNSANKGDRMSPAGASSVGTSANLPLRADMDEDDASTTYGLMDMKPGVESHGDLDFQQRCHEKDMLKLNNIIPYSDNDKDPNGPLTISRFNAAPKQNGDMMYTSLDVSMPMPVDDTYVSYCGRNDASGLMYATIDHPQRIAMSHRPLGVPSAATLGGVTTMTLPHGAHLQHQMHQMQHPLQQQVPSLIQVPSSLSGGSGLMAGGSSVAIAGDPRSLTRHSPHQHGTVTTAATELSLDSSQIPLIGRPNRESSV